MMKRFLPLLAAGCATLPASNPRAPADEALAAGRLADAVRLYRSVTEENPRDFQAWYGLGVSRLRRVAAAEVPDVLAETDRAAADLTRAIEAMPLFPEAHYARAMAYAVLARHKDAVRDLLTCAQAGNDELKRRAHRKLAMLYDEAFEEESGLARDHLEAYVALGGDDSGFVGRLEELRKRGGKGKTSRPDAQPQELRLEEAKRLAAGGDLEPAAEILSGILSDPKLPQGLLGEAKLLYARTRLAIQQEREASALYEVAARLAGEEKPREALRMLEEILDRYPATSIAQERARPLHQALGQENARNSNESEAP